MLEIVGELLRIGATVNAKVTLAVADPSLTVRVITDEPVSPATGSTTTERVAPVPPNCIFTAGTKAGFEELPVKVRFAAGVSRSFNVNGMAIGAPFSATI